MNLNGPTITTTTVCYLFIGQQDVAQSTKQTSMKLDRGMGPGPPKKTPYIWAQVRIKGRSTNPEISFSLILKEILHF